MPLLATIALLTVTSHQVTSTPWPSIVAKNLYATRDYRGTKCPLIRLDKWLSPPPDFKGKVVIVDYWSTACQPCRDEIAELNRIASKYRGKVVVMAVSSEDEETVSNFMRWSWLDYPVALNGNAKIGHLMGFSAMPYFLILSPDWVVRWQGPPGDDQDTFSDRVIDQVLAASQVK